MPRPPAGTHSACICTLTRTSRPSPRLLEGPGRPQALCPRAAVAPPDSGGGGWACQSPGPGPAAVAAAAAGRCVGHNPGRAAAAGAGTQARDLSYRRIRRPGGPCQCQSDREAADASHGDSGS